jgi:PAS domain-containing protein
MWKEQPIMTAALPEQRLFLAILTSVTGLAVCRLTTTPFGLLAPIGALYLYAEGRAVLLLRAALAIAFIGTAIAAYSYADARHDLLLSWVAFFAVALCVGESVAAKASGSLRTDAVPALIWSTTPGGTPSYVNKRFTDVTGATLEDITAPNGSPSLSVIHADDRPAAAQANRSFA